MTIQEKYKKLVDACEDLRCIEDIIKEVTDIRSAFRSSDRNKRATFYIHVNGEDFRFELDTKTADSCLGELERCHKLNKNEVIESLKRLLDTE